jgi:hypothetical protein
VPKSKIQGMAVTFRRNACEKTVPLADGETKRGAEAAREALTFCEAIVARQQDRAPTSPSRTKAPNQYRLMTTVPQQWTPFISALVQGDNRKIQLQRAAMPRIVGNDPNALPTPRKVKPRTMLLRVR